MKPVEMKEVITYTFGAGKVEVTSINGKFEHVWISTNKIFNAIMLHEKLAIRDLGLRLTEIYRELEAKK